MKTKSIIAALVLGVSLVACGQPAANKDGFKAPKSQVDSVSYLLGINFGTFLKNYDFGNINYAEVVKGMKDFVNATGNMNDTNFVKQFKVNPEEINEVFTKYIDARREFKLNANKEAGEKFLEANKAKNGVQVTESGLQYKIIATGSDKKAGPDDTVLVNYKGTLLDGTVFDQSPEEAPAELSLNRVIPGWTEGLQLVGEGGKIELYIPSELAYGERGAQPVIEPNSALIFEVEIVEVHPAEVAEEGVEE